MILLKCLQVLRVAKIRIDITPARITSTIANPSSFTRSCVVRLHFHVNDHPPTGIARDLLARFVGSE